MAKWMYKEESEIKHLFNSVLNYRSICGAGKVYLYNNWQYDDHGLKVRRECQNCKGISGRAKNPLGNSLIAKKNE